MDKDEEIREKRILTAQQLMDDVKKKKQLLKVNEIPVRQYAYKYVGVSPNKYKNARCFGSIQSIYNGVSDRFALLMYVQYRRTKNSPIESLRFKLPQEQLWAMLNDRNRLRPLTKKWTLSDNTKCRQLYMK